MSEIIIDIPNYAGWNNYRIDQLCSIARRGTAPVYVENSSIKAIGQRCVTHSDFDPSFARPHSENATSNILEAEKNDILLNSTGTGTIGRSVIFNDPGKYIVDGHVTVLRPNKELVDSRWLNAVIRSKWFQRHLERFCYTGSTNQLELSRSYLNSSSLPTPTEEEQSKIGDILDSIDAQIRETEAIIAKLQQVKQGLLHDLLTRGVDENGELRPSYEEAPELYKTSELGWIPKEWDVVSVGQEIKIKHGFAFDGSLFTANPVGYPLLVPGNFHRDGKLYFTESNTKYYDGKYSDEYLLQPKDMVVVMTDLSPQTLILGRAAILDKSQRLLHNQRIGKMEFLNEDEWIKSFFVETLSQESIRRKVIITATGTTVRHTSPDKIYDLDIPKPPKNEQIKIDEVIQDAWKRLDQEVALLKKLQLKKSGFMDDLLTGKVRVTELLKQKQAS